MHYALALFQRNTYSAPTHRLAFVKTPRPKLASFYIICKCMEVENGWKAKRKRDRQRKRKEKEASTGFLVCRLRSFRTSVFTLEICALPSVRIFIYCNSKYRIQIYTKERDRGMKDPAPLRPNISQGCAQFDKFFIYIFEVNT